MLKRDVSHQGLKDLHRKGKSTNTPFYYRMSHTRLPGLRKVTIKKIILIINDRQNETRVTKIYYITD